VECKEPLRVRANMRDELRDAKSNRDAAVAPWYSVPPMPPTGIAPFDVRAGDVYCVVDPAAPDAATLEAAVRLARLMALQTLRERDIEVDAGCDRQGPQRRPRAARDVALASS